MNPSSAHQELDLALSNRFAELGMQKPELVWQSSEALSDFAVIISFRRSQNASSAAVSITISSEVASQATHIGRISGCIAAWVPSAIKLYQYACTDFQLSLSASDEGEEGFLVMDGPQDSELMPDIYSLGLGYGFKPSPTFSFDHFKEEWLSRSPTMFWRGSTTGHPGISSQALLLANRRVQACLLFRDVQMFDLKISNLAQVYIDHEEAREILGSLRIFGDRVSEGEFSVFRYYPDLPGNAQAWGTIRKMLDGCLVFRPSSSRHLHCYRFFKPWIHYVPVQGTLEDLAAKKLWADENPARALSIAWRGKVAAERYLAQVFDHLTTCFADSMKLLDA